MQGVLTSREAWVRFSCSLFAQTEMEPSQIAKEADQMLIEYLKRFPDPKKQRSAKLLPRGHDGEPEGVEFTLKKHDAILTETEQSPPSGDTGGS